MELYERIRYLAEKKGVSFAKLAKELGIPQQTFHQWLKPGSQRNIWEHLPKIIEIFPDIRPAWLYMGELPVFWENAPEQAGAAIGKNFACSVEVEALPLPPSEIRGKLRLHPGYHDDPLGRIEMLTNVRGSSALELQDVFGVDLKELKPFTARYDKARRAWDTWRAAGGREEDAPDVELPRIPEEWLDYFWRHYGPSPHWILYGGGEHSWAALVRPRPGMAELERLRGELAAVQTEARRLRSEVDLLRSELADVREKNARLEGMLEERTPSDKSEGRRVPSPPDANSMQPGRKQDRGGCSNQED